MASRRLFDGAAAELGLLPVVGSPAILSGAYWIAHPDASWPGTPTGAQIAAGNLSSGSPAAYAGSETAPGSGSGTITEATAVTGLTAGTAYRIAWVVYDAVSDTYSNVVVGTESTLAALISAAGGIPAAVSFGTAVVSWRAAVVGAGGLASTVAVGQPALSGAAPGQVSSAGGIASTAAVGSPGVAWRAQVTAAGGIGSASAVGSPAVSSAAPGQVSAAGAIESAVAFGVAAVTWVARIVSAGGLASAAVAGVPAVSTGSGAQVGGAGGIASTAAVGQPSVGRHARVDAAGGIASQAALGLPILAAASPGQVAGAGGIASSAAVGAPALTWRIGLVGVGGIPSAAAAGQPSVVRVGGEVLTLAPDRTLRILFEARNLIIKPEKRIMIVIRESKATAELRHGAELDYAWDWSQWLEQSNDSIQSFEITASNGAQFEREGAAAGVVYAFISADNVEVGTVVTVTCQVVTVGGRRDLRTFYITVVES